MLRGSLARQPIAPQECVFADHEIIVSKTDTRGVITYANNIFLRIAGYTREEVMGKPHNMIRHPDMPRCVFKLLWERLREGKEIFAYVVNATKHGDYYWVFAHVTPTFDEAGKIIGYHSNRRCPRRSAIDAVIPLYAQLRAVEAAAATPQEAVAASTAALTQLLQDKNITYDQFVLSL